jgi:hypothetical protein
MTITDEQVEEALRTMAAKMRERASPQECMRAALEAAEAARWQPIETYPNDGTPVLVSDRYRVWVSSRQQASHTPQDGYGPFDGRNWYLPAGIVDFPTHWMSLPTTPSSTTEGDHDDEAPR